MRTSFTLIKSIVGTSLMLPGLWHGQIVLAADYTVEMTSDWKFAPKSLQIQVGDTVTWVNHDYTLYLHDSVCAGYWNTGLLDVDEQSTPLAFPAAGTFNYRDSTFYLFGMTGTIIVNPVISTSPTPATLIDPKQLPDGRFQFTVSNLVVGATYVIQISTDLTQWSNLSTNLAANSVEDYVDGSAAGVVGRYYRTWNLP